MNRRSLFRALIGAGPALAIAPTIAASPNYQSRYNNTLQAYLKFTNDEYREALAFVLGDQWPADIVTERRQAGRPVLTINRLSPLVYQIAEHRRIAVSMHNHEWRALVVDVYRNGADAQRLYNWMKSEQVEAMVEMKRDVPSGIARHEAATYNAKRALADLDRLLA